MTSNDDQKSAKIAKYIDENLKQVFSDLERDELPDRITDLLSVLRAQDDAKKDEK
ncbi:NepR family anti-sigma factor [Sulfitobacter sp. F26204]|uniref:NepR family anti-sigma factor n=1 Tax=Sulfitobacter sp. F26204 TaxID=2996014 RepID=UPI00225E397C|nr:NepR family anti-sigma factor [Sulfitobacter sp. F26204]MCX7559264.1 NepR family anti-sigma factor [Sulfitobacter sp. F26204]